MHQLLPRLVHTPGERERGGGGRKGRIENERERAIFVRVRETKRE